MVDHSDLALVYKFVILVWCWSTVVGRLAELSENSTLIRRVDNRPTEVFQRVMTTFDLTHITYWTNRTFHLKCCTIKRANCMENQLINLGGHETCPERNFNISSELQSEMDNFKNNPPDLDLTDAILTKYRYRRWILRNVHNSDTNNNFTLKCFHPDLYTDLRNSEQRYECHRDLIRCLGGSG